MTPEPDPWAVGTPITETHPLHAMIAAWASIETTLAGWGIPQAEQRAKAIVARLAALDPPVLVVHPDEMKDEDDDAPLRAAAMEAHDAIVRYLVATYGDPNEHEPRWYENHEGPWMRAPQLLLEARLLLRQAIDADS